MTNYLDLIGIRPVYMINDESTNSESFFVSEIEADNFVKGLKAKYEKRRVFIITDIIGNKVAGTREYYYSLHEALPDYSSARKILAGKLGIEGHAACHEKGYVYANWQICRCYY